VTGGLRWGIEPICSVLEIAPSTYWSAKRRPPSARSVSDGELKPRILAAFAENYSVYGARKVWTALGRKGVAVGRDRVARLMRVMGLAGATRAKKRWTTRADPAAVRAPDLVHRNFTADRPDALWVADFTYVSTWSGVVYVAFITDVFSRRIVGWKASMSMRTSLVFDALEMASWARRNVPLNGLVCHSDAGSQYTSIAYTERLSELGAHPSIGTVGDSYDNALAETVNGLYKAELVRNPVVLTANGGHWKGLHDLEIATCGWVSWFNERRLHEALNDLTPAEYETAHYRALPQATAA